MTSDNQIWYTIDCQRATMPINLKTNKKEKTMQTRKFKATFTEGLLATKPSDEKVHETYIAAKRREGPAADEMDAEQKALAEIEDLEKGTTVFHRNSEGKPIVWDYQVN